MEWINMINKECLCYVNKTCRRPFVLYNDHVAVLDFTGTVHGWFGWMAKIQFLPAVLALNVGVVIALVLLTLLWGVSIVRLSVR